MLPGEAEGAVEVLASLGQVGAVHLEVGQQLRDRLGELLLVRIIRGVQAGDHLAGDPAHLGVEHAVGHDELAVVDEPHPVDRPAAQTILQVRERRLARGVDEHPVDQRHRVIPCSTGGGPGGGQLLQRGVVGVALADRQDLLHQHVGATGEPGEIFEVLAGVTQAVRVVHAQPVHQSLVEPAPDLGVRLGEPLRVFHPDRDEGVHREEPAVVQCPVGLAPADQLVVLPGMHGVRVLVASARAVEGKREPLVVVVQLATEHLQVGDPAVRQQVVVPHDRDAQPAAACRPVDVEGGGVGRVLAVGEHVPPPLVLPRASDADVVGHDVDQHAHAEPAGLGGERSQAGRATAGRIDRPVVGDVVAVLTARLGREQRGQVDPVDPQLVQVRQRAGRRDQVEVLGDLQAVRAGGSTHHLDHTQVGRAADAIRPLNRWRVTVERRGTGSADGSRHPPLVAI